MLHEADEIVGARQGGRNGALDGIEEARRVPFAQLQVRGEHGRGEDEPGGDSGPDGQEDRVCEPHLHGGAREREKSCGRPEAPRGEQGPRARVYAGWPGHLRLIGTRAGALEVGRPLHAGQAEAAKASQPACAARLHAARPGPVPAYHSEAPPCTTTIGSARLLVMGRPGYRSPRQDGPRLA